MKLHRRSAMKGLQGAWMEAPMEVDKSAHGSPMKRKASHEPARVNPPAITTTAHGNSGRCTFKTNAFSVPASVLACTYDAKSSFRAGVFAGGTNPRGCGRAGPTRPDRSGPWAFQIAGRSSVRPVDSNLLTGRRSGPAQSHGSPPPPGSISRAVGPAARAVRFPAFGQLRTRQGIGAGLRYFVFSPGRINNMRKPAKNNIFSRGNCSSSRRTRKFPTTQNSPCRLTSRTHDSSFRERTWHGVTDADQSVIFKSGVALSPYF